MLDQTTPQFIELPAAGGGLSVALTPGAAALPAQFNITGIPSGNNSGGTPMRNYAQRFWNHTQITADPDAAGNAINWDKLQKINQSFELQCQTFGTPFPHKQSLGATMGHLTQVIGLGYMYPEGARTQIPASTDTDVVLDLFQAIPIGHECFAKSHESAQWVGFYDGGTLTTVIDVSTILDGDYAGLVTKTAVIRAHCEFFPSPDEFIGVPVQWRNRQVVGGTSPVLKGIGIETGWNGLRLGSGMAGLWWATDATGIGMGGPDGVDNFLAVGIEWRGQKLIQNLDPFVNSMRIHARRRVGPVAGTGATIIHDRAGWPTTMAATTGTDNRPAANSQIMALELIGPGDMLETSKVQTVLGDKQVDFQTTAAIANPHQFISFELMEFSEDKLAQLAQQAGFSGSADRKQLRASNVVHDGQLRYTRVMFN